MVQNQFYAIFGLTYGLFSKLTEEHNKMLHMYNENLDDTYILVPNDIMCQ